MKCLQANQYGVGYQCFRCGLWFCADDMQKFINEDKVGDVCGGERECLDCAGESKRAAFIAG